MKTKTRALLEVLCGDDYPKIVEHSNAVVPMREIPFPNAGLTIRENFIEICEEAKKIAEKIAASKGIPLFLSSQERLIDHLKEEKQQLKIGKLPIKYREMYLLIGKIASLLDLTSEQSKLLQFIFDFFQGNNRWPIVREVVVADQLDGTDTESVVESLHENKILIQDYNRENKKMYCLTLLGILHANGSEKYWEAGNFFGNELKKAIKKQAKKNFNEIPGFEIINETHGWSLFKTFGEALHTTGYNHSHFDVEFSDCPKTVSQIKNFTEILSYLYSRYQIEQEPTYDQNLEPIFYPSNIPGMVIGTQMTPKKHEIEIKKIIEYKTNDPFRKGHIEEINRAYTSECYTCVFILCRKVIENMIIDILGKKFPPEKKENKELYFDVDKGRFKNFSIILDNFYKKRNEFDLDNKKIVKRIVDLAKFFKKDADDKTHSWFHLVRKRREIDDIDIQGIIDLIKRLEEKLNI